MATTWTPERRARQAALIRTWKPWQKATGPRTPEGKAKAARNAWRSGHWKMLRELSHMVNAEIQESRDLASSLLNRRARSCAILGGTAILVRSEPVGAERELTSVAT